MVVVLPPITDMLGRDMSQVGGRPAMSLIVKALAMAAKGALYGRR